jgi:peptidoglycan/xylan/chitin deacetylase (PgdA/CDA1 family)
MLLPVMLKRLAMLIGFSFLLAACGGGSSPDEEEITFNADDVARFRELVDEARIEASGSGAAAGSGLAVTTPLPGEAPVIDLSLVPLHESLRTGQSESGEALFKVTGDFANLRDGPRVNAGLLGQLLKGDTLTVLEYPDAAWAKVRLPDGREGYVSLRLIAKLVTEDRLAEERKAFEGQYFVDFGFLNVRSAADTNAEKIGELSGQAIVTPMYLDEVWARLLFEGREGYVARQYLSPFAPPFLVRQDRYDLPILHYRADEDGALDALVRHLPGLQEAGYSFMTLSDLYDHLLAQEERDVRLPPRRVVLAISGVTVDNAEEASSALRASNATATMFLASSQLSPTGLTNQTLQTLRANGFDIQSGAHSGDDLRSLTNAQLDLELQQSRVLLEERGNGPISAIAYPWGGVNERVKEKAAAAGYLFGLSNREGTSFTRSQLLELPAIRVSPTAETSDILGIIAPAGA